MYFNYAFQTRRIIKRYMVFQVYLTKIGLSKATYLSHSFEPFSSEISDFLSNVNRLATIYLILLVD